MNPQNAIKRLQKKIPPATITNLLTLALAIILILQIGIMYRTRYTPATKFDEDYWTHSSYFYYLLFKKKDIHNPDWFNYISYDQPPIAKYIIGLSLDIFNNKTIDQTGGLAEFIRRDMQVCIKKLAGVTEKFKQPKYVEWLKECNKRYEKVKPAPKTPVSENDYTTVKTTIITFAALDAILIIILCARQLKSPLAGLTAAILFLTNKNAYPVFTTIYVDAICQFFVLAALITLIELYKKIREHEKDPQKKNTTTTTTLAILEGTLIALAIGTKFITTYIAATVAITYATAAILDHTQTNKKQNQNKKTNNTLKAATLAIITITAATTFIAINPYLYPNPIGNTIQMVEYRYTLMEIYSRIYPKGGVKTFGERAKLVFDNGLLLGLEMNTPTKTAYLLILFIGAAHLARKTLSELRENTMGAHTIMTLFMLVTFMINGYNLPHNWERYYIPFATCTAITFGLGAEMIIKTITKDNTTKQKNASKATQ